MSKHWTGYAVCVYPKDPDEPRCKVPFNPDQCPNAEAAAELAQAMFAGGTYHQVIVDKWENGKIVKPAVLTLGGSRRA